MNEDVPTLVRALLTGGEVNELENLLTKRVGLVRRQTTAGLEAARHRSSLTLINLSDPLLANLNVRVSHGPHYTLCMSVCLSVRLFQTPLFFPQFYTDFQVVLRTVALLIDRTATSTDRII